jgi:hypothetical protein
LNAKDAMSAKEKERGLVTVDCGLNIAPAGLKAGSILDEFPRRERRGLPGMRGA